MDGKFVKSFGKGVMNFPHGFFIDREGNIWVTDGAPAGDARGEAGFKKHMGHQVYKFSPAGKVLMTLGEAGVAGADDKHFNGPTGIVVAQNGDIWVTDGHGSQQQGPNKDNMYGSRGGNNRLVRFSKDGKFMKAWGGGVGSEGSGPLQFNDPHGIDIDSEGRLYIADRGNQRIQVLDKEGTSSPAGRSSASRARWRSTTKATFTSPTASDAHWNPAGSAASATSRPMDQGVHPRRGSDEVRDRLSAWRQSRIFRRQRPLGRRSRNFQAMFGRCQRGQVSPRHDLNFTSRAHSAPVDTQATGRRASPRRRCSTLLQADADEGEPHHGGFPIDLLTVNSSCVADSTCWLNSVTRASSFAPAAIVVGGDELIGEMFLMNATSIRRRRSTLRG